MFGCHSNCCCCGARCAHLAKLRVLLHTVPVCFKLSVIVSHNARVNVTAFPSNNSVVHSCHSVVVFCYFRLPIVAGWLTPRQTHLPRPSVPPSVALPSIRPSQLGPTRRPRATPLDPVMSGVPSASSGARRRRSGPTHLRAPLPRSRGRRRAGRPSRSPRGQAAATDRQKRGGAGHGTLRHPAAGRRPRLDASCGLNMVLGPGTAASQQLYPTPDSSSILPRIHRGVSSERLLPRSQTLSLYQRTDNHIFAWAFFFVRDCAFS